mmetsp:Transcript_1579/g.3501  ORF Transcript_1579/g.3501 Transcript_1579/m.3501 type:complete len:492 (+) Transcript_1579:55-1530(+)
MKSSTLAFKFGLLFSAGMCFSASADSSAQLRDDVMVLMYETDESLRQDATSPLHFFEQRGKVANLQTVVFGEKLEYHGFGDKYQTLKPLLDVMDEDKLIILADARDVILNVPDNGAVATLAVDNFMEIYKKLTANAPNAVVISAEAQCCVSAMAHTHPREYFDSLTMERKSRACSSGKEDCLWYPSKNIEDWQVFMEDLAHNVTGENPSDVYLNAGLMAGYPADLINLLNVLDIHPYEDDQAVLSGLMYQFPEMIKLDYGQEMFGNNQWPRGLVDGCVFETQGDKLSLIHTETGTEPLILHTPGSFYSCLDVLIEDLGGVSQQRYILGVEHMDAVAANKGFNVASDTSRRLNSDTSRTATMESHTGERRLDFLQRMQDMVIKIKDMIMGAPHLGTESTTATKKEVDTRVESNDEVVNDEVETINYASTNYGNYGNYGSSSNYGNYGNHGTANDGNYGTYSNRRNYGNTNDGNYGNYRNYGNTGQYNGEVRR